jgi:MFS family permease
MGAAMMLIAAVPLLPGKSGTETDFVREISVCPRFTGQVIASVLLLFFTGASGGILLVPLEAFIQARPPADRKGRVIAAANCTAFIGILLAGLAFIVLDKFLRPTDAFGVLGAITLLVGVVVRKTMQRE